MEKVSKEFDLAKKELRALGKALFEFEQQYGPQIQDACEEIRIGLARAGRQLSELNGTLKEVDREIRRNFHR